MNEPWVVMRFGSGAMGYELVEGPYGPQTREEAEAAVTLLGGECDGWRAQVLVVLPTPTPRYGYCRECGEGVDNIDVIPGDVWVGEYSSYRKGPARVGRMSPCGHQSGSADFVGLDTLTASARVAAIATVMAALES